MDIVYDDLLAFSGNRELKNVAIALPFVKNVMASLSDKSNMVETQKEDSSEKNKMRKLLEKIIIAIARKYLQKELDKNGIE